MATCDLKLFILELPIPFVVFDYKNDLFEKHINICTGNPYLRHREMKNALQIRSQIENSFQFFFFEFRIMKTASHYFDVF